MLLAKSRILVLLVLISTAASSQDVEKMKKRAQKFFYAEDLKNAALAYQEILTLKPSDKLSMYRLEICSLIIDPGHSSIENLLKYKSSQGKKDKFYNYWLGRAYFQQNQFKKAMVCWNNFLAMDAYKSKTIIAETEYFLSWAERAESYYTLPQNHSIEQLPPPVNSTATEYSPVYFAEAKELLFLSSRTSTSDDERFHIYHTAHQQGEWTAPVVLDQLGDFLEQNANIEIVDRLSKLYLYKGDKKGGLFVSDRSGAQWTAPQAWSGTIPSSRLESHFFINEQEDRILFARRKKGNSSDLDIFETRKTPATGQWAKPVLFSASITSEMDEDYPYLTADGNTLYFSSKGFESIGGYDVFRSDFDSSSQTWSAPQSFGHPTNSIDNDIQFKIDPTTRSGYFVSDRLSSQGSYDIFFFHESNKILLSGRVIDGKGTPASLTEIYFEGTGMALKTMTDDEGKYEVKVEGNEKVKVKVYFGDQLVHQESFQTPLAQSIQKDFLIKQEIITTTESDQYHDPAYEELEDIGSKFRVTNKAVIPNIYFGFDQYLLDPQNKAMLSPLLEVMKKNPKLKIEVGGHTDNIGDEKTNLRLSLLRAKSVANYLIAQGIPQDRIVAKGYGYAIPMATNDQEKEGREFNRRIEVVVIE